MPNFRTQRLANRFPIWTKLRRDPSSLGQRFFDTFAGFLEEHSILARKIAWDLHLFKPNLGVGYLHSILLNEADYFPTQETAPGITKYVYPTVVGTIGVTDYTLNRYEDVVSLLNAPPDRISSTGTQAFTSYVVWDSASPYVFTSPPRPERLAIEVSGSTFYSRSSEVQDLAYSGYHTIQILGLDENEITIRERVQIDDDGVYYTKNFFKEVTEVRREGFDGSTIVRWFPYGLSYEPDPYRSLVLDEFEGQLKLSLTSQDVMVTTYSYVLYEANRFKLGKEYRRPGVETTGNSECLAEVVLLDSSENPYTAVDLAINHQTSKMYVLDDQGLVHVYDHGLPPFDAFSSTDVETKRSYLELVPLRHYSKFGDTEYIYTDFARNRFGISKVEIKRRDPSGNVEYLQTDKITWNASQAYIFAPYPDERLPEKTWQDIRFTNDYDELGQWEFTITCISNSDTTVYKTAVMCGSLIAEASIDTGVASPEGLGFSKEDWIAVSDGSTVYYFEELVDGWLADPRKQQILTRSEYDSVEVTY